MISKVCLMVLLSCVLSQANPLSSRYRRNPKPELSFSNVLQSVSSVFRTPMEGLTTGAVAVMQATGVMPSGARGIANGMVDAATVEVQAKTSGVASQGVYLNNFGV